MKLCINNLEVFARIGEYDWEKVITQKITINCQLTTENIIDYCIVSKYIAKYVIKSHYNFIEELGKSLCAAIKKEFRITSCQITIEKHKCISHAKSASVICK